ncbi:MAG TPA: alpha-1,4-glucan--maltose-1-phosphate maltosyltransferase [Candidatus Dormibacteraeota bacterium]
MVIENVRPELDGGRFAAKGSLGEPVQVEADIFADGHDLVSAVLRWRGPDQEWREEPLKPVVNDRWAGEFEPRQAGLHDFDIEAWVDHFLTWEHELERRLEAGQNVAVELEAGALLVEAASRRAPTRDAQQLRRQAAALRGRGATRAARSLRLRQLMGRHADRSLSTCLERPLTVKVDPERARSSAWYELFPRSASPDTKRPGTLRDVETRLPYVRSLGFDVLYLPPIHPIGHSFRKGRNNTVSATPSDVGSPWAIGSEAGGHKSIAPELGTLKDFRQLVRSARRQGIELAMDYALQCSPDHPYVKEHPEWFRHRPDGSIRYAENPPKKYQDIYPFDFESEDWRELWDELLSILLFWCEQGVRTYRVDNPHTKPFAFWEWAIARTQAEYPGTIFLAEAFTRPKVMYELAKLGFTQSYTYFAWRQQAWELKQYAQELFTPPVCDFLRPNFWPNTPDILTEQIQKGGPRMSALRFVLAATMSASYGIFGPSFERVEVTPLVPGKEEYLDSEKYQVRHWDGAAEPPLAGLIRKVNAIRAAQPALRHDRWYRQLATDNEMLFAFLKTAPGGAAPVCVVANLDAENTQRGWIEPPVAIDGDYDVVDLLNDAVYRWRGAPNWNFVELSPSVTPAHVLRVGAPVP